MEPVRVEIAVEIARPPERVFDYVTAPYLWHTWHPATEETPGAPQRPLVAGEKVRERIRVGWRHFEAEWTVTECRPPHRWVIATTAPEGAATIVYEIATSGGGSRFTRTLAFRSARWPWRLLDATVGRWILEHQSRRALDRLKAVLEGAPAAR